MDLKNQNFRRKIGKGNTKVGKVKKGIEKNPCLRKRDEKVITKNQDTLRKKKAREKREKSRGKEGVRKRKA
uniref:Uncharacterized protein n=1 Tax=Romanomermis culicivorax TaxID=13658 RepID=A0A915JI91_ROMCU